MERKVYSFCILIFLLLCSFANYQITKFDGRGYFVLILSLLFILRYYKYLNLKPYIFNPPVMIWGGLMVFHICNTIVKDGFSHLQEQNIIAGTFTSLLLMVFISYLYNVNKDVLYKCLIISTTYYLFMGYIFGNTEQYEGRLSGFIYTTQLGQLAGVACMIISMYIFYKQKFRLSWLYLFPIFIMLLAGARNGFLMVLFSIICLAVPYFYRKKKILLLIILLLFGGYYFVQDTNVFDRLLTVNEERTYETGTIWDSILGERAFYYVVGYKNFIDNCITGIGLLNFKDYNFYQYAMHSEIMTHMAEGGIIGLTMYLGFKIWYIRKFLRLCSKNTPVLNQCLIIFLALMALGISARIYQYTFFFLLYGIINGEIIRFSKNNY